MSGRALPEGTIAFLLTDIESSTRLLRELGESYDRMLEEHHAIVRGATAASGTEVRCAGDGFIFAFTDPGAALSAAVDVQRALSAHRWPDDADVRVRVAVHRGEAKVLDGDYVSLALHQAVRLCAAANGGQILVSPDVVEAAGTSLPEFAAFTSVGTFHVRDFDGDVELFEIRHPDLVAVPAPPRVPSAAVHNLPAQRTTFVGRRYELGEITKLLGIAPLVTLVGPGGIGKTRLGSEAGLLRAGEYADGVWLVPLSGVDGPGVEHAVAGALGFVSQPDRTTLDTIIDGLTGKNALLIMDNCEHVVGACADLCDRLLASCPSASILATSREPLLLTTEHVYRIDPLGVPVDGAAIDQIRASDAVQLFEQRARQADQSFVIDDENARSVAEICRLVDGVPLAVELVAARCGTDTPAALADQVEGALLDLARRGGDARHRTLRGTIEWSTRALDDEARRTFSRLAFFRSGFTVEAAAAVADAEAEAMDGIARDLVRQSLLELSAEHDPPRFRLLEPVRLFARDVLESTGASDETAARFVSWCAGFMEEMHAAYYTTEQTTAMRRVRDDLDNIRAGFELALARNEWEPAARIANDSTGFASADGRWREVWDWCNRVLEFDVPADYAARMRLARAHLSHMLGDNAAARRDFAEAGVMHQREGDVRGYTGCLIGEAQVARATGDVDGAIPLYEQALDAARRSDLVSMVALCLADLGLLYIGRDSSHAQHLLQEAAEIYDAQGHKTGLAGTYNLLGAAAADRGDLAVAEAHYRRAIEEAEAIGFVMVLASAERGLGGLEVTRRRYDEAERLLRSACARFTEIGMDQYAAAAQADLDRLAETRP